MPFYPAIPASDGTTLDAPANAVFEVFELSDTKYTKPLELTTDAGQEAAPLTTTAQGVVPPVNVDSDNLSHNFKSGSWVWRRDSFDGAAANVEASRVAAQEAAAMAQKPTDDMVDRGIARADLPQMVEARLAEMAIPETLGQYELMPYVNMGDSWADPVRVNITSRASPAERLARRLSVGAVTHRGFSSRTMEDLANISLGGANGWVPRTKALVTVTSCHLNNTKYLGTAPAAERGYKHAWAALLSTLTADAAVSSNSPSFAYSPGWVVEATTGVTTAQAANNSTGGGRFRTTTAGAYALVNVSGPSIDIFAVARTAGAGVMTVTVNSTGALVGSLDLTGTVAQETPAVLKLRNLGAGTRTLRVTHSSGKSLTLDSVRVPSSNPPPIVLVPAPDTWEGSGNTLPDGDPSRSYNEAQATARGWMKGVAADYPSVTICDLNGYGFDKVADFYTDLRHLNDRGAAKWANAVADHLRDRGYSQGLNVLGSDPEAYAAPSIPSVPTGGQDGTGGDGKIPEPAPRQFSDSSLEWLFSTLTATSATSVSDSVKGLALTSSSADAAPRVLTEGRFKFLRFRGTEANPDFLANTEYERPSRETIALLFRLGDFEATRRYMIASGNAAESPQSVAGVSSNLATFIMNEGLGLNLVPAVTPDTSWHVMVLVRNGDASTIRVDAVEHTGDAGTASPKTGFRVARATNNLPSSSTPMDLGALVTFDYAASAAQREAIVAKLSGLLLS